MFVVIWLLTAEAGYTAFAFITGALISIACGAIDMVWLLQLGLITKLLIVQKEV